MTERPYATLLSSDLEQMISSCIQAGNRQGLLKIQIELRHRKSSSAKRLKVLLGKHLNPDAVQRPKNPGKPKLPHPRLGPAEKPILELERLAESAMHQDRTDEVRELLSLLADRTGLRAKNLKNKVTIYLWDQGLMPHLFAGSSVPNA